MAKVAAGKATRHVVYTNMTNPADDLRTVPHPAPRHSEPPRSPQHPHDPFTVGVAHSATAPLLKRATAETLDRAREVVANAIAESARRNEARYLKPARNTYRLKPGTVVGDATTQQHQSRRRGRSVRRDEETPPPLLAITDEIAQAAALVAEAEADDAVRSGNLTRRQAPTSTFWMENLARKGTVPWGDNSTYAVFRNVRDYGATGNGVTVSLECCIPSAPRPAGILMTDRAPRTTRPLSSGP
jgi:hypothetical protein